LGLGALAAALAVGIGIAGMIRTQKEGRPPADVRPRPSGGYVGPRATPFMWPGVNRPPTVPAAAADLADDEPVIGIVVAGRPRAYRLKALAAMTGHVVNDVVAGSAVTVTHCDRTHCTRIFTASISEPLPIMTGGYKEGLLLKVGDGFYHQADGTSSSDPHGAPLPLALLDYKQVSWKEWRTAHPDTDVYVADPRPGPPPEAGRLSRPPGP
jgi:hypothetical protein